ncbi:MAG TPA: MnhB domain-containing protein [Egibacteraceae bacterium]|nr:MnhB domain-containing protein [Egibacteraceae bacterium]
MTAPGDGVRGAPREPSESRPSLILEVSTRAMFHVAVVFAVWLLAAGHNRPGGGFVGGLTISAALVLVYADGGSPALRRTLPAPPLTILGLGMLVAQGTAVVPLLFGRSVLESAAVTLRLPVLGAVKLTTTLVFDIGVLLIVLGLVAKALDTLGAADPTATGDIPAPPGDTSAEGERR